MSRKEKQEKHEIEETEAEASSNQPYGTFSHRQILTVIGALVLSILLAALDQTIVTTALPAIASDLNGLDMISWVITAYLLAQTVSIPLYGKLGDLLGRKKLLLFGIVVFLIGSALSGIAQTMGQLIAFRALQGIGAGGLMVTAMAVIGDVIPARDRGKYLAFIMPVFGLATVFGPTLGGFLVDAFTWRWIFYINMPIGIAAIWAVVYKLDLPSRPLGSHKIDILGAFLLAVSVSSLVLVASWGGATYAWSSLPIILLGIAVVVFGALFVWVERRVPDPIFPLFILKNKIVLGCILLGATVGLSLFGTISYLPTFLQLSHNVSAFYSGLLLLPFSLGLFITAIVTGRLISRTGRYKIFPIFGTICATVGMFLLSTISATTSFYLIDVYMFLLGMGIGAVMPVITQVAQNAVHQRDLGVATSGVNFFRQISGALGVAIAGTLFTTRLHAQLVQHLSPEALKHLSSGGARINPEVMAKLPADVHHVVMAAYGTALPSVFLVFVPVLFIGVIVAFLLKEIPLSTTAGVSEKDELEPEKVPA